MAKDFYMKLNFCTPSKSTLVSEFKNDIDFALTKRCL